MTMMILPAGPVAARIYLEAARLVDEEVDLEKGLRLGCSVLGRSGR